MPDLRKENALITCGSFTSLLQHNTKQAQFRVIIMQYSFPLSVILSWNCSYDYRVTPLIRLLLL